MKLKKITTITLVFVLLMVTTFSIYNPDRIEASEGTIIKNYAWDVLDIVNRERSANGLRSLTMDEGLMKTAQLRAEEIKISFSHTRPNGTSCFTAFPDNQWAAGENIAMGARNAESVMSLWMNSPGHRANILSSDFKAIGVACYECNDQHYWVQCFGDTVNNGLRKGDVPIKAVTTKDGTNPMYRMYNPNSGEHFYTASYGEIVKLGEVGWNYEGVGWYAPKSGKPVYRMYNPNAGDHHYTPSAAEKNKLVSAGWRYEGVCWRTGGSKPLYRAYNPNATAGAHHFTTSKIEIRRICAVGWRAEGIGWYGVR